MDKNKIDSYLAYFILDSVLILEMFFNEEKEKNVDDRVRENWKTYISEEGYSFKELRKYRNFSIGKRLGILSLEMEDSKKDILSLDKKKLAKVLAILKLLIIVKENSVDETNLKELYETYNKYVNKLDKLVTFTGFEFKILNENIKVSYNNEFNYLCVEKIADIYYEDILSVVNAIENILVLKEEKNKNFENEKTIEDVLEEIIKSSNKVKDMIKDYQSRDDSLNSDKKWKGEFKRVAFEKKELENKIIELEKIVQIESEKNYQFNKELKLREEMSYLRAVKDIFKVLNDEENMFIEKINLCAEGKLNLSETDVVRLSSNLISVFEVMGIRKNPKYLVGQKIIIKEKNISEYRCSAQVANDINIKGISKARIKYPSWLYLNGDFENKITVLVNPAVEKEE